MPLDRRQDKICILAFQIHLNDYNMQCKHVSRVSRVNKCVLPIAYVCGYFVNE